MAAGMARLSPFRQQAIAMAIRQMRWRSGICYPLRQINFCIGRLCRYHDFRADVPHPSSRLSQTLTAAMAASVLLLVPGFPLINSVGMFKATYYCRAGARWAIASLLTLATCVGVVMSMTVWGYEDGYNRLLLALMQDISCLP